MRVAEFLDELDRRFNKRPTNLYTGRVTLMEIKNSQGHFIVVVEGEKALWQAQFSGGKMIAEKELGGTARFKNGKIVW